MYIYIYCTYIIMQCVYIVVYIYTIYRSRCIYICVFLLRVLDKGIDTHFPVFITAQEQQRSEVWWQPRGRWHLSVFPCRAFQNNWSFHGKSNWNDLELPHEKGKPCGNLAYQKIWKEQTNVENGGVRPISSDELGRWSFTAVDSLFHGRIPANRDDHSALWLSICNFHQSPKVGLTEIGYLKYSVPIKIIKNCHFGGESTPCHTSTSMRPEKGWDVHHWQRWCARHLIFVDQGNTTWGFTGNPNRAPRGVDGKDKCITV